MFVLKEDNALKSTILEKDANREFILFVFVGKHAKDPLLHSLLTKSRVFLTSILIRKLVVSDPFAVVHFAVVHFILRQHVAVGD